MKKIYSFLLLFLAGSLLYSLDESTLEVAEITYLGKVSHDQFMSSYSNTPSAIKKKGWDVYTISKLSNTTWRKINSRLHDYDHEAGDFFNITMTPWGDTRGPTLYSVMIRYTSNRDYEWYCISVTYR